MLRAVTWVPVAVSIALASVPVGAQEARKPEKPPVFSSDVQLITVDAVVVDRDGRPVPGLTKDDFVVTEDGKRQEVVSFEAFAVRAGAPTEPLQADGAKPAAGRSFALLLDDISMTPAEATFAKRGLARFVDRSLANGDTVRLATTSGAVAPPAHLPDGRERVLNALDAARGLYVDGQMLPDFMSDAEAYWISTHPQGWALDTVLDRWARTGPCTIDRNPACVAMATAQAQAVDAIRRDRTHTTLAALQRVMQSLAADPGRKSVLFVSTGFVADGDPIHRETAALSREVNAAVYFLDARGLQGLEASGVPAASYSGAPPSPQVIPALSLEASHYATGGAQDLAMDTGGFTVRDTNDVGLGASRIVDQSRIFYLLGFHPPAGKKAGSWRKLKVEVAKKGYEVHARRGYKTSPAAQLPSDKDKKATGTATVASIE